MHYIRWVVRFVRNPPSSSTPTFDFELGVAAGFEITSSCPTSLTVVGGGSVKT